MRPFVRRYAADRAVAPTRVAAASSVRWAEYRSPVPASVASVTAMSRTVGSARPAGLHLPVAVGVRAWLADTRG